MSRRSDARVCRRQRRQRRSAMKPSASGRSATAAKMPSTGRIELEWEAVSGLACELADAPAAKSAGPRSGIWFVFVGGLKIAIV